MAIKVVDLPSESSPTEDDLLLIRENNTGTTRKMTIADFFDTFSYRFSPTGAVLAFAGASAPAGFLMCDGSAVSRSTYDNLFALIGTTYGSGNGVDTFNVPDLRGRVVVGKAASGTFNNLNNAGGEESHTMTVAEMPSHTHTQNSHSHTTDGAGAHNHSIGPLGTSGGSYGIRDASNATSSGTGFTSSVGNHTHGVNSSTATNQNTGGGNAFNVLQPYRVLNYVIKT